MHPDQLSHHGPPEDSLEPPLGPEFASRPIPPLPCKIHQRTPTIKLLSVLQIRLQDLFRATLRVVTIEHVVVSMHQGIETVDSSAAYVPWALAADNFVWL